MANFLPAPSTQTSTSKDKVSHFIYQHLGSTKRIILLSLLFGILVWIMDAFMDYITFYRGQGTFFELLLLAPPPHELYIRILIILLFLIFGWLVSKLINQQKQTQSALVIEKAELRATLYSIGDAVIATDIRGNITRMNPVAEQLTGWMEKECIGQPLEDVFRIINEETRKKVENPTVKVLKDGVIIGLANHTLLISKDGQEIPIADAGAPIFDQDHQITGVVLVFRDQTEERLSNLLITTHLDLIEYAASHTLEKFLTFGLKQALSLSNSELAFFQQLSSGDPLAAQQIFSGSSCLFREFSTNPQITNFPINASQLDHCIQSKQAVVYNGSADQQPEAGPIFNQLLAPIIREEQVIAVLGIGNNAKGYHQKDVKIATYMADILWETQQKIIGNEKLRTSEENYRLLFQNILNGFSLHRIVTDENGTPIDYIFQEVNKAFEEFTGLDRKNILGKRVTEVLPGIENDPADWIRRYGEVALSSKEIRFEQYSQNLERWYSVLAYCPKPGYFATIFQDITKQKMAAQELKESQRQLSTLMDNLPGIVYRCKNEPDWTMEFFSQGSKKITGYSPEDVIGNNKISYSEMIHPEDRQMVWDSVQKSIKRWHSFQIQYRIITADWETKWVWEQGQAVLDDDGNVIALEGVISDITEQKTVEETLQNQAMMMENVSDAVIFTDLNTIIQRWNKAAEDMLGWKEEEVIGKRMNEVVPTSYPVHSSLDLWGEFQQSGSWKGEAIQKRKDGSSVTVLSTVSIAKDKQGKPIGIIAINKDITKIKQHEEALNAQREKLSALAQQVLTTQEDERRVLSRDLHDTLGQALAVHKIYITILEQKIQRSAPELISDLEKVIKSVETANQITRSLSQSLRPPDLDSLGLEIALRNLCTQTAEVSGKTIRFYSTLGEYFHSDADITLYRVGQEALNNILKHSEATEITFECVLENDVVELRVIDNGIGFDPQILITHQNGLGIIGMHERMEHIGGSFQIESSPQKGTMIVARYPISETSSYDSYK